MSKFMVVFFFLLLTTKVCADDIKIVIKAQIKEQDINTLISQKCKYNQMDVSETLIHPIDEYNYTTKGIERKDDGVYQFLTGLEVIWQKQYLCNQILFTFRLNFWDKENIKSLVIRETQSNMVLHNNFIVNFKDNINYYKKLDNIHNTKKEHIKNLSILFKNKELEQLSVKQALYQKKVDEKIKELIKK